MSKELTRRRSPVTLPAVITDAGEHASKKFIEFFTATIRNKNTRMAYAQAIAQFLRWCDERHVSLLALEPTIIGAYVEQLGERLAKPSVKQHLAAVRMLLDHLVLNGVLPMNPASSVRGPTYVAKRGKTPVLSAEDARKLLDSIDTSDVVGLRDRALIGTMVFSFARISAVLGMKVEDYYQNGKRWWIRLHEKGGKFHEVPANHNAEAYLDAYLQAAGITGDPKTPLFRSAKGKTKTLTEKPLRRNNALDMIKRRALAAGLSPKVCCHTFRATGITAYLENGGTIEKAQQIAAHESPRTTKLYDRTSDEITLDEVERIAI